MAIDDEAFVRRGVRPVSLQIVERLALRGELSGHEATRVFAVKRRTAEKKKTVWKEEPFDPQAFATIAANASPGWSGRPDINTAERQRWCLRWLDTSRTSSGSPWPSGRRKWLMPSCSADLGGGQRAPRHRRPKLPGAGRAARDSPLRTPAAGRRHLLRRRVDPVRGGAARLRRLRVGPQPHRLLADLGRAAHRRRRYRDAEARSNGRSERSSRRWIARSPQLGIEHDEHGNRAKAYLWCLEAVAR